MSHNDSIIIFSADNTTTISHLNIPFKDSIRFKSINLYWYWSWCCFDTAPLMIMMILLFIADSIYEIITALSSFYFIKKNYSSPTIHGLGRDSQWRFFTSTSVVLYYDPDSMSDLLFTILLLFSILKTTFDSNLMCWYYLWYREWWFDNNDTPLILVAIVPWQ